MDLLAAFDFANIIEFAKDNLLPIILGSQLIPVNKPGTPYQPLIAMLVQLIGGKKPLTPDAPQVPSNILSLLVPFIQQLSNKPPVATVVPPPDPATVPSDPSSLVAWLMKLLSAPEQTTVVTPLTPTIENPHVSPVDARWEHFAGCFMAMVTLYPDEDITAVSKDGNTRLEKTARVKS